MAPTDKAKNSAQQTKGKVKEVTGKVTGKDKLRAKGTVKEAAGNS